MAELSGVEWRSPEIFEGHLRLHRRSAGSGAPVQPDQDPAAVVFGLGYGPVHESLPFAAAGAGRRAVTRAGTGGAGRVPA
ncbi:DUF4429 domain-containing protein [Streptomyces tricolor]|nr:DUF4429 domain-containing protein [Streptomyces tricolor]